MCWKPEFIVLILASTSISFFCSLGIEKNRQRHNITKFLLAISLCTNLGLLFFFKYANFFSETLAALCRMVSIPFTAPMLNIILPVGISFYTFQTLSYTFDVYRNKVVPERDFIVFSLFVSFFPQLVAGPIEQAKNLLPQLKKEHPFSYENVTYGLKLMAWGYFKKLVIADQLSQFVDPVYNSVASFSGGALVVATCAFAFQIYCDFSGYSDIARGCAKTMGIDLMINFRAPYLASSVEDFWKRHHISLTSWFRDYVYIPLGGNRKGILKKHLFVLVTFFLSGLWHGASWTFVVWGMMNAFCMNLEDWGRHYLPNNIRSHPVGRVCTTLATFGITSILWVFFRANSLVDAAYILRCSISGLNHPLAYCKSAILYTLQFGPFLPICLMFVMSILFAFDLVNEKRDTIVAISKLPIYVRWPMYVVFLLLLVLLIPRETTTPFLYFQF